MPASGRSGEYLVKCRPLDKLSIFKSAKSSVLLMLGITRSYCLRRPKHRILVGCGSRALYKHNHVNNDKTAFSLRWVLQQFGSNACNAWNCQASRLLCVAL